MVLANVLLATGPLFVRLADTGPIASAFWRMALALPVLALIAGRTGSGFRGAGALWFTIAASGVLFALDLASWHLGIERTRVANATLFGNTATLFFPLYGFLIARAWPQRREWAALGLALVGGAILMGRSWELSGEHLVGDLLSVAAGVFYTFYFIAVARARERLAPIPLLALSTLASALPLLLFALAMGEQVWPRDWTPLIALALFSQLLGQGLMVYVLGRLSPLVIGLGLMLQPAVSALLGWLVLREALGLSDWIGMALVMAALLIVRGREER